MPNHVYQPKCTQSASSKEMNLHQASRDTLGHSPRKIQPTTRRENRWESEGHTLRTTPSSSPPLHTLPLYATIPLSIVDDGPSSKQWPPGSPPTLSPWLMLPSPPHSPPWLGAPPVLSESDLFHTTNAILRDSNDIYLHPILEDVLPIPPRMMYEPREARPADVNNYLSEPATNPGLGFLTIILHVSGHHVPVHLSAVGRGTVALGDVLQVLNSFSVALLEERNVVGAEQAAANKAHVADKPSPMAKGLWTWVDGRPVAGYLTIGMKDVV